MECRVSTEKRQTEHGSASHCSVEDDKMLIDLDALLLQFRERPKSTRRPALLRYLFRVLCWTQESKSISGKW